MPNNYKYTKWPQNIPNDRKSDQMAIKYSIPLIARPSKIYINGNFWFEKMPSGNPVSEVSRNSKQCSSSRLTHPRRIPSFEWLKSTYVHTYVHTYNYLHVLKLNIAFILLEYCTQWQWTLSFDNSTAMCEDLITLHPGGIRTRDLMFWRRARGPPGQCNNQQSRRKNWGAAVAQWKMRK
jgi:hypothetical protein